MAKNSSNHITFIVSTNKDQLQELSQIRHFENLKVAFNGNEIWVKGFSLEQINSAEVKTLPFKSLYYLKDGLLFPKDSLLPYGKIPSMLLWTNINLAFALESPKQNHNFFGINSKVKLRIVPSEIEQETTAILVKLDSNTKNTIENAPAFRLNHLNYTIINNQFLLIIGTPVLPIKGHGFWLKNGFLFPNGYDLEFPILLPKLKSKLNPSNSYYVLWQQNNSYSLIGKNNFQPLSISSFRLSISTPKV